MHSFTYNLIFKTGRGVFRIKKPQHRTIAVYTMTFANLNQFGKNWKPHIAERSNL